MLLSSSSCTLYYEFEEEVLHGRVVGFGVAFHLFLKRIPWLSTEVGRKGSLALVEEKPGLATANLSGKHDQSH